jgi:hypothetical protein
VGEEARSASGADSSKADPPDRYGIERGACVQHAPDPGNVLESVEAAWVVGKLRCEGQKRDSLEGRSLILAAETALIAYKQHMVTGFRQNRIELQKNEPNRLKRRDRAQN